MTTDKNNTDTIVLVTGCGKGFGLLFVRTLASLGYTVYAGVRSPSAELDALAAQHQNIHTLTLDVQSEADIYAARDLIQSRHQHLDVLINNAGYGLFGGVRDFGQGELLRQFSTNVVGSMMMCTAVLPLMDGRPSPLVINISSIASYSGLPMYSAYSASKAAVNNFSMALTAEEHNKCGLKVAVVQPGPFATEFRQSVSVLNQEQRDSYLDSRPKLFQKQEDPQIVADLICKIIRNRVSAPAFREYPIGAGSWWLQTLSRLVPSHLFTAVMLGMLKKNDKSCTHNG